MALELTAVPALAATFASRSPQDILRLGVHGIAMSRFSGLWSGLKLATNVVDGSATVHLADPSIVLPDLAAEAALAEGERQRRRALFAERFPRWFRRLENKNPCSA